MSETRLQWIGGGAAAALALGALVYVTAALTGAEPERPVFSPQWTICDAGDSCVVVQAPCGEWQPVNAAHQASATIYYNHLMTVVEETGMECVSASLSRIRPAARCRLGRCELVS